MVTQPSRSRATIASLTGMRLIPSASAISPWGKPGARQESTRGRLPDIGGCLFATPSLDHHPGRVGKGRQCFSWHELPALLSAQTGPNFRSTSFSHTVYFMGVAFSAGGGMAVVDVAETVADGLVDPAVLARIPRLVDLDARTSSNRPAYGATDSRLAIAK